MIKELREYIKASIYSVNSDLRENPSAFYNNDIGETAIEQTYQIELNNIQSTIRNNQRIQSVDALISIFGQTFREQTTEFDELMDDAICIRDCLTDLKSFNNNSASIINAEALTISASTLADNDNLFKVDINISFTQAYFREE